MKMIEHNHFICHLILGTFTEYPCIKKGCRKGNLFSKDMKDSLFLFLVLLRLTFTFWVIVFSHTFRFWQQYLV